MPKQSVKYKSEKFEETSICSLISLDALITGTIDLLTQSSVNTEIIIQERDNKNDLRENGFCDNDESAKKTYDNRYRIH